MVNKDHKKETKTNKEVQQMNTINTAYFNANLSRRTTDCDPTHCNGADKMSRTSKEAEVVSKSKEDISRSVRTDRVDFSGMHNVKEEKLTYSPADFVVPHQKTVGSGVKLTQKGQALHDRFQGKTVNVSYTTGSKDNKVTINLTDSQYNCLAEICDEVGIDATYALAIMAHESGFNPDASSGIASGLMQVHEKYYQANLTRYDKVYNIAKSYSNNVDNNPKDPYGNMAAGMSLLKYWKNTYGETDMLKAYAQGNKGNGWSNSAINADNEFRDIKAQLDKM